MFSKSKKTLLMLTLYRETIVDRMEQRWECICKRIVMVAKTLWKLYLLNSMAWIQQSYWKYSDFFDVRTLCDMMLYRMMISIVDRVDKRNDMIKQISHNQPSSISVASLLWGLFPLFLWRCDVAELAAYCVGHSTHSPWPTNNTDVTPPPPPPDSKVQGANMGPIWGRQEPRWAPCWPHELCYLGATIELET